MHLVHAMIGYNPNNYNESTVTEKKIICRKFRNTEKKKEGDMIIEKEWLIIMLYNYCFILYMYMMYICTSPVAIT